MKRISNPFFINLFDLQYLYVIPFDYQNIILNGNEFIATLNGEEIVFDSDGFLTDESIKKETNREKQFKKNGIMSLKEIL